MNSHHNIDTNKLEIGIKIQVDTRNSIYYITVQEDSKISIQGGKYFPEPTDSMMIGTIHYNRPMIVSLEEERIVTTSPVKGAQIIGQDWQYEIWETDPHKSQE